MKQAELWLDLKPYSEQGGGLGLWTEQKVEQKVGEKVWIGERVYSEGKIDWAPWTVGHLLGDPELSVGEDLWA